MSLFNVGGYSNNGQNNYHLPKPEPSPDSEAKAIGKRDKVHGKTLDIKLPDINEPVEIGKRETAHGKTSFNKFG